MWALYFASILVGIVFLFVPGFMILKAFKLPTSSSISCAPLFSTFLYTIACIAYGKLGIFADWIAVALPVIALCAVAYLAVSSICHKRSPIPAGRAQAGGLSRYGMLILFIAIGIAAGLLIYSRALDTPLSFAQTYDNAHHLGEVRSFLESGNWSPLATTLYPEAQDSAFNPLPGTSFYPSVWHMTAALIASALDAPVALAENATNFLFAFVVLPAAMHAFLTCIFGNNHIILLAGSVFSIAFAAFPWGFFTFGPLYANVSGYAMMPIEALLFMSIFKDCATMPCRARYVTLSAIGLVGLACAHPNSVFSLAVFLIPFCLERICSAVDGAKMDHRRSVRMKAACCLAFCIAAVAVWSALYCAPFLHDVVSHRWAAFATLPESLVNLSNLTVKGAAAQPVLAIIACVGIAFSPMRKEHRWLVCSLCLFSLIYVVCVTTEGFPKHFLAGFWYTDSYRIVASMFLAIVPLAAMGVQAIFGIAKLGIAKAFAPHDKKRRPLSSQVIVVGTLLFVFLLPAIVAPTSSSPTGLSDVSASLTKTYKFSESQVYSTSEREFVAKVQQVIPHDAVLINEPNDGTAFAYGADGLNIVYRDMRGYASAQNESPDSTIIRERLNEIATDEEVAQAVRNTGAAYLIQLDHGADEHESKYLFSYNPDEWKGIDAVTDDTPGFEVVLSEGDMRLYKISG